MSNTPRNEEKPSETGYVYKGCFVPDNCILVFVKEDYGGVRDLIVGPWNYPSLKSPNVPGILDPTLLTDWDDAIRSIMVGNEVKVTLWEDPEYDDDKLRIDPGSRLPNLGQITGKASSLKIEEADARVRQVT